MTSASRYRIKEWDAVVKRDNHLCRVCGDYVGNKQGAGAAHRLINSVPNIKEYGFYVVHSRLNQMLTCADCNSKVIVHDQQADDLSLVIGLIVQKKGLPVGKKLERRLKQ